MTKILSGQTEAIKAINAEILWHIETANNAEYTQSLEYRLLDLARATLEEYNTAINKGEVGLKTIELASAWNHYVRN